jgi:glycosyltransferase involved in cell wall biosynthesis
VLDAWGCDLPVVTTPVGGLCDVLQNGVNALVFEPGDVQTLSNHLELLMKNPYIRKQLSLESQKLSSTIFNIKSITKQLDNIYSSLYKN